MRGAEKRGQAPVEGALRQAPVEGALRQAPVEGEGAQGLPAGPP